MELDKVVLDHFSRGKQVLLTNELKEETNYSYSGFRKAIRRMKENGEIIEPVQGFLVIVPPDQRIRGVSPSLFIDELMDYRDRQYYVGGLTAADFNGASHQAPQVFQVMVDREHPEIELQRTRIQFIQNRQLFSSITLSQSSLFERRKTRAGYFLMSSLEATVTDCLHFYKHMGGLNNVVNIMTALSGGIPPKKIYKYTKSVYGMALVQRMGYLFDTLGFQEPSFLFKKMVSDHDPSWTLLNPSGTRSGHSRDKRFRIIENFSVQADITRSTSFSESPNKAQKEPDKPQRSVF